MRLACQQEPLALKSTGRFPSPERRMRARLGDAWLADGQDGRGVPVSEIRPKDSDGGFSDLDGNRRVIQDRGHLGPNPWRTQTYTVAS